MITYISPSRQQRNIAELCCGAMPEVEAFSKVCIRVSDRLSRPTAIRKPSHASFGLLSFGTRPLGLIEAGCEPSNDAGFGKSTDRSKSYPMAETSGPRLVMQCPCKPKKNVGTLESVLFFGLADCSHIDCFP